MTQENPSWRTICAMVNSMIGGTMLTLPILFRDSGLGIGVLVLILSGWISYKTCALYVMHMSEHEENIEETIRRLLGKRGEDFFRLITGIYLVFLNIIYVDLLTDQLFNILYFILHKTDSMDWITEKNEKQIVFNKISIQVIALVMFLPLLLTMFIKNLSFLVKLTAIGVVSVFTYTGYIFFKFAEAAPHITADKVPPLFSLNFGNLVGTCAVAFTIHTVVNPIAKANLIQANNLRDLKISYVCGFLIYATIGVLGSLAIIDQDCNVTIINCFLTEYKTLTVEILYFFMLLTVFPCFINVGRTRLLTRLFGSVFDNHVRIFNFGFMFISSLFAFLSPFLRLDLLMNLVGSILCFFFIYYIPIRFHWACLYEVKTTEDSSIISSNSEVTRLSLSLQDEETQTKPLVEIGEKVQCAHAPDYVDRTSRKARLVIYGLVMISGVAIGIYGLYDFVTQIIDAVK